jgi:hypothetical protein
LDLPLKCAGSSAAWPVHPAGDPQGLFESAALMRRSHVLYIIRPAYAVACLFDLLPDALDGYAVIVAKQIRNFVPYLERNRRISASLHDVVAYG